MSRQSKHSLSTSTSISNDASIDNKLSKITSKGVFETAIVTDYISNPEEFLESNVLLGVSSNDASNTLKGQYNNLPVLSDSRSTLTYRQYLSTGQNAVIDSSLVDIMPRNSILGINITGGKNKTSLDKEEIFFPFFSHVSMPIKSGEQVWVFYDNIAGRKIGYWISRKVGTIFVDDINYTHIDRQAIISMGLTQNLTNKSSNRTEKVNTFGMTFPNPSLSDLANKTLVYKDYDSLISKSFSHDLERKEFIGEAVPRYASKCADLVLQGSNNTIITMTHEDAPETGTIKIVTGRKTIPAKLKNIRTIDEFEHEEIDKLSLLRGDFPDLTEGTFDGASSTMLNMTEKFGGMIELINADQNSIKIIPSDSEELEIDGGIVLQAADGKFIRLGGTDAEESAILGDTLADILSELMNNLLTISLATGVGPTGPLSASVDGGGAKISQLISRIESIKSTTTKVK
jgi:hypothetical protein